MSRLIRRLGCLILGHRPVRVIDRIAQIETDGWGGMRGVVEMWHLECAHCRTELEERNG
jgi:hypothetical protein